MFKVITRSGCGCSTKVVSRRSVKYEKLRSDVLSFSIVLHFLLLVRLSTTFYYWVYYTIKLLSFLLVYTDST